MSKESVPSRRRIHSPQRYPLWIPVASHKTTWEVISVAKTIYIFQICLEVHICPISGQLDAISTSWTKDAQILPVAELMPAENFEHSEDVLLPTRNSKWNGMIPSELGHNGVIYSLKWQSRKSLVIAPDKASIDLKLEDSAWWDAAGWGG